MNKDSSWCFIEKIFKTFLRYEKMKKEKFFMMLLEECVWDLKALVRNPHS